MAIRYTETTSVDGSNNLLYNGTIGQTIVLTNMISLDPLFVDRNNADFRLNTTSPALHTGVENANISLLSGNCLYLNIPPSFDYVNNKRAHSGTDIGAYESVYFFVVWKQQPTIIQIILIIGLIVVYLTV